ncbi:Wzz/FepE/Etk N-terminal domain-containing protein [Pseudaquabacterium rugosum]|uniref:Wzz/FepE/Etk N-terminal domain-containing protein n=1 Tax=Pseudaquabacterium rugosum TaxID=2984194 RepID=A0ABU9B6X0_9BURK
MSSNQNTPPSHPIEHDDDEGLGLLDIVNALRLQARWLVAAPILLGGIAFGGSYLITPTFTATTTFLPPQQQQSATAAALSQLSALGALTGGGGGSGVKSTADQYIALMQSVTVSDRMLEKFDLINVYEAKFRIEARNVLAGKVAISAGKKDGLITVSVDDTDPKRAAAMANQYVQELRLLTNTLALSEAQQRRAFFEDHLKKTRDQLAHSQQALQQSGFNSGVLKTEPKLAADAYARLQAEATSAEIKLQTLRRSLADSSPEIQQQQAIIGALKGQLARAEVPTRDLSSGNADYIGKYRDFKYQESLFELFARQYEMAKVDESREGALIQVIDAAQVPELKSKPKRATIALGSAALAFMLTAAWAIVRFAYKASVARARA